VITPLPHSLAPLPDESLLGFLLRLAHRLDTSPLRLAQATGLLTDQAATRIPTRLLLVRRGFRHLRTKTALPAGAPKPTRPGPCRPPGSRNKQIATHRSARPNTRTRKPIPNSNKGSKASSVHRGPPPGGSPTVVIHPAEWVWN
jgi:hypothetical protein